MYSKREAIIAEYLTGDYSYRQLGTKHGIDFCKIHYWMGNYKGKIKPMKKAAMKQKPALASLVELKRLGA